MKESTQSVKTCKQCGETFPNMDRLFEHQTYVHSIFYCTDCGLQTRGSKSKETIQHKLECPHTIEPYV